jgi:hypothetical protein
LGRSSEESCWTEVGGKSNDHAFQKRLVCLVPLSLSLSASVLYACCLFFLFDVDLISRWSKWGLSLLHCSGDLLHIPVVRLPFEATEYWRRQSEITFIGSRNNVI